MLVEMGGIGVQQPVVPRSGAGDRAAAEIHRPASGVENHLHAGRVVQLRPAADRRGQRRHHGGGIFLKEPDHQVDRFARQLGLVALEVHDDVDVVQPSGNLGHAVGPAPRCRIGHFHPAAKRSNRLGNLGLIGRHTDAARPPCPPRRLVGVLNQRLARLAQQQLPRQSRRRKSGGDYNIASAAGRRFWSRLNHGRSPSWAQSSRLRLRPIRSSRLQLRPSADWRKAARYGMIVD
jgi:hypothetical protein